MTQKKPEKPSTADTTFPFATDSSNELRRLKFELQQAETRLRKARIALTSAEADITGLEHRIAALASPRDHPTSPF
jgi:hypothetical protein